MIQANMKQAVDRICPDRVFDYYELPEVGRQFIASRSKYPNGELLSIYLEPSGSGFLLTDYGVTSKHLGYESIDFKGSRHLKAKAIAAAHGVKFDGESFFTSATHDTIAERYHALCDAILQASALVFQQSNRSSSMLNAEVRETLRDVRIQDKVRAYPKYKYQDIPGGNLYPIDWAIQTPRERPVCHLYGIRSDTKAVEVVAASHFFQTQDLSIPTLSIVDTPIKRLSQRHTSQLHSLPGRVLYRSMPNYRTKMIDCLEEFAESTNS